jgi:pimeloyl-ACP methyl ester carboxylesterase
MLKTMGNTIRSQTILMLIGALGLFLLCTRCSFMPDELEAFFDLPLPAGIEWGSYTVDGATVSYVQSGNPVGMPVVLVHGSPGSWEDWKLVIARPRLKKNFHMIAVNRPGWDTQADPGRVIPDIADQARLLRPALDIGGKEKKAILVGHSLGGPIVLRMAVDYPGKVAAVVLLAPSLDPDLDAVRWYNKLADYRLVKVFLPEKLARANDEIMALPDALRRLGKDLARLKMPIILVQGQKDELVDPANADYARRKLVGADFHEVLLPNFGHLIPHLRPAEVVIAIEDAAQMAAKDD